MRVWVRVRVRVRVRVNRQRVLIWPIVLEMCPVPMSCTPEPSVPRRIVRVESGACQFVARHRCNVQRRETRDVLVTCHDHINYVQRRETRDVLVTYHDHINYVQRCETRDVLATLALGLRLGLGVRGRGRGKIRGC